MSSNKSADWDEAAYWVSFNREARRRGVVLLDGTACSPELCECGVPDEVRDREEGLIERALSALRRVVRAA